MKIIAIINQKGGVGKSTASVNIAAQFATQGMSVLVLDMDPQSDATLILSDGSTEFDINIGHVLSGTANAADAILQSHIPGISYIPNHRTFSAVQVSLFNKASRELLLTKRLRGLNYDVVIIDCPPENSLATQNAICAAKYFLIPTDGGSLSINGLAHLLALITELRTETDQGPSYSWKVLRNMIDPKAKIMNNFIKGELAHIDDHILKTVINRFENMNQSIAMAQPIHLYKSGSVVAQQYKDLAIEIRKWLEQEDN